MKHTYSPDESRLADAASAAAWLSTGCTRNQRLSIVRAVEHWCAVRDEPTQYPDALHVAWQLKHMRADAPILLAALFGTDTSARAYPSDFVREHYGVDCARLVDGVRRINELSMADGLTLHPGSGPASHDQAERLRRMVLSLVEDVRVVLVKLAYRTQRLYRLAKSDGPERIDVARETLAVYAPLANRLGLGQLKWELEDVAFRIVEPMDYKRVAKALEENRAARESYIRDFVSDLQARLADGRIEGASVSGRPKHIYSIWKKMRAKSVDFSGLFDVRAVRVLVDDVQACYGTLGVVHGAWQPIGREFDDYIANPKDNGYRSLHTAVIGPGGKPVEVQIRTRAMDDDAENGVAAHWAYKEGQPVDAALQKGINSLRQLLDDDDDAGLMEGFGQSLDANRVYAFTPKGEVLDLVAGSTPLDFAYHVHSEIGHRCRGAKVDGAIVPLTYALRTGDRVEILTSREAGPSRDWMNPSLDYLASSRARAKVRAWFNARDHASHVAEGRDVLERELKRLRAANVSFEQLAARLKQPDVESLFASIGRGATSSAQVAGAIEHLGEPPGGPLDRAFEPPPRRAPARAPPARTDAGIRVRGVGKLLTNMAACCSPVPWDPIVGYITRGKGVTIHRADCTNVINLAEIERPRLIEVDWGEDAGGHFRAEIRIEAYDRTGLLRDVSTILTHQGVDVVGVHTASDPEEQMADMRITMQVAHLGELAAVMDRLRQLRNVSSVERVV